MADPVCLYWKALCVKVQHKVLEVFYSFQGSLCHCVREKVWTEFNEVVSVRVDFLGVAALELDDDVLPEIVHDWTKDLKLREFFRWQTKSYQIAWCQAN